MKSRPNTTGLRTIQFHRGNPESTTGNGGDDGETIKYGQSEKPGKENSTLNEDPTNEDGSLENNIPAE